jgi:hypothetical protein
MSGGRPAAARPKPTPHIATAWVRRSPSRHAGGRRTAAAIIAAATATAWGARISVSTYATGDEAPGRAATAWSGSQPPATAATVAPAAASASRRLAVGAVAASRTKAGPTPASASGTAAIGANIRHPCGRRAPTLIQAAASTIQTSPAASA